MCPIENEASHAIRLIEQLTSRRSSGEGVMGTYPIESAAPEAQIRIHRMIKEYFAKKAPWLEIGEIASQTFTAWGLKP